MVRKRKQMQSYPRCRVTTDLLQYYKPSKRNLVEDRKGKEGSWRKPLADLKVLPEVVEHHQEEGGRDQGDGHAAVVAGSGDGLLRGGIRNPLLLYRAGETIRIVWLCCMQVPETRTKLQKIIAVRDAY